LLSDKRTNLYIILCAIFLTNALLAEMIGVKIFSLETLMGIRPAEVRLMGNFVLSFNLTAGVIIWPFVFVTSDIINEYFGKPGVRKISFLTAGLITYVFVAIFLVTELPPADFWLQINGTDPKGLPFDINYAFSTIFRQGLGIILGSITAFLVGQLLDVYTFQWIRSMTGSKNLWLRATGSTIVSQFVDSFVVLGVAFYLFGNWSWSQVVAVGIINYVYKFVIAILLTPLLYVAHGLIDQYLGKEIAIELTEKAQASK
jgi:uncharacterized integral membrane protein (TIGR00697 family)